MRLVLVLLYGVACSSSLTPTAALSQDADQQEEEDCALPADLAQIDGPTMEPIEYTSESLAGCNETYWLRPERTDWVILVGCGAGAEGQRIARPVNAYGRAHYARGGAASEIRTEVVRVERQAYRITLGDGSREGRARGAQRETTFREIGNEELILASFEGAELHEGWISEYQQSTSGLSQRADFGRGQDGPRGLGEGGTVGSLSPVRASRPGVGACSGGGGAVLQGGDSGAGAPGYLAIIPLPNWLDDLERQQSQGLTEAAESGENSVSDAADDGG